MADRENDLPVATHTGEVEIGAVAIPCFVLENEERVLSQTGMLRALGMSMGGGPERLARFAGGNRVKPFINNTLLDRITSPIRFHPPQGGKAYGYEATILSKLCEAILEARDAGNLQKQQMHIAREAEALMRGFAQTGIIALVDEATGYQDYRTREALQEILDAYLQEDLRPWTKTFPDEFYKQMFRLKGWTYDKWSAQRPGVVGRYTNDLIYSRLAPGVLQKLRQLNPSQTGGGREHYHHQHLTDNEGYPKLKEHISSVVTLMRASSTWQQFKRLMDRAKPQYDENYELHLTDPETGEPW